MQHVICSNTGTSYVVVNRVMRCNTCNTSSAAIQHVICSCATKGHLQHMQHVICSNTRNTASDDVLHTNRVMTRFTTTYDVLHVFLYTIHGLYRVSCIALMFHVLLSCFMHCNTWSTSSAAIHETPHHTPQYIKPPNYNCIWRTCIILST